MSEMADATLTEEYHGGDVEPVVAAHSDEENDDEEEHDEGAGEDDEDEDEDETVPLVGLPALLYHSFFANRFAHESDSQAALAEHLRRTQGRSTGPAVFHAFEAVDRAHFLPTECARPYFDAPIQLNGVHQSAPGIYATALGALELKRGLSFLNVGAGSGYFSALVSYFTGAKAAMHVTLELKPELVAHARTRCEALGLTHIKWVCGNLFDVQRDGCMQFDRIYVGAGAGADARFLFELLKPGGIVVGPFDDASGGPFRAQKLLKVSWDGHSFAEERLMDVSFKELQRPAAGAPLVLPGPLWGTDEPALFPRSFISTVALLRWGCNTPNTLPYLLPWDVWAAHILPMLPSDCFEPPPAAPVCARCGVTTYLRAEMCLRCKAMSKAVHFCEKARRRTLSLRAAAAAAVGASSSEPAPADV